MFTHFISGFFSVLTSDIFAYILCSSLPVACMGLAMSIFCSRRDFEK